MGERLRVGIVGAGGIGQHHARWHDLCGNDVVGFVGTSDASVTRTRKRLVDYFGYSGRGYTSLPEMMSAERPDIVAITSPYTSHKEHLLALLDSEAHILCEKPLTWNEAYDLDRILADGREMVLAATHRDQLFCLTAQYPACLPMYHDLYASVNGGELGEVETIEMDMEVKRRGPRKLWESNWIDVASHPLSLAIAVLGGGSIVPETATCSVAESECHASFRCAGSNGTANIRFTIRDIEDGTPPRRFGINGFLVDWDGFADEGGVYRATLTHRERSVSGNDFLHALIEQFTTSVKRGGPVAVDADSALLNLELQVALLRLAREGAHAA